MLVLGTLILAVWLLLRDDAPLDDSRLQFERPKIADVDNGFLLIEQAVAAMDLAKEDEFLVSDFHDSAVETDDDAKVATLVERNRKAIDLFLASGTRKAFQVPEIKTVADDTEYLHHWRNLTRLATANAKLAFIAGDEAEAFRLTLATLAVGTAAEHCGGCVIHYLVALSVKGMAVRQLQWMCRRTTLGGDALTGYAQALGQHYSSRAAAQNALRSEFQVSINTIEVTSDGANDAVFDPELAENLDKLRRVPGLYRVQATRNRFIEYFDAQVAWVDRPFSERPPPPVIKMNKKSMLATRNVYGEMMFGMLAPAIDAFGARPDVFDNRLGCLQVLMAGTAFELETGAYPTALDELVPGKLKAVPIDWYDGKPLRYNPALTTVYGVGENGVDDGGPSEMDIRLFRQGKLRRNEMTDPGVMLGDPATDETSQ
jgi:hypothetical protein